MRWKGSKANYFSKGNVAIKTRKHPLASKGQVLVQTTNLHPTQEGVWLVPLFHFGYELLQSFQQL